jgi:lipopolysaccharide export system protein LptC
MSFLRVAWDRVSLYLPIVLMGILALGTYWLVRSTPVFTPPEPERPPTHEPDYYMKRLQVKTFDATGKLRSEVMGLEARHFPDTDLLEIDQVRIRSFNEHGRLTTATARRAVTNADGSEVELMGDALVVREPDAGKQPSPRLSFSGEYLKAFLNTEKVQSHRPVLLTRGKDQFTGDSMTYDNIGQVIELKGRVKGLLVPNEAR